MPHGTSDSEDGGALLSATIAATPRATPRVGRRSVDIASDVSSAAHGVGRASLESGVDADEGCQLPFWLRQLPANHVDLGHLGHIRIYPNHSTSTSTADAAAADKADQPSRLALFTHGQSSHSCLPSSSSSSPLRPSDLYFSCACEDSGKRMLGVAAREGPGRSTSQSTTVPSNARQLKPGYGLRSLDVLSPSILPSPTFFTPTPRRLPCRLVESTPNIEQAHAQCSMQHAAGGRTVTRGGGRTTDTLSPPCSAAAGSSRPRAAHQVNKLQRHSASLLPWQGPSSGQPVCLLPNLNLQVGRRCIVLYILDAADVYVSSLESRLWMRGYGCICSWMRYRCRSNWDEDEERKVEQGVGRGGGEAGRNSFCDLKIPARTSQAYSGGPEAGLTWDRNGQGVRRERGTWKRTQNPPTSPHISNPSYPQCICVPSSRWWRRAVSLASLLASNLAVGPDAADGNAWFFAGMELGGKRTSVLAQRQHAQQDQAQKRVHDQSSSTSLSTETPSSPHPPGRHCQAQTPTAARASCTCML
ncbi:LOW QUALITY PROTEIN: hypothetical protein CVT26_011954 [Gymnopilus dilepis]|uniref:Uncharacterized protein n=1 Tax=Gymnopilus dilepis TaxID=231916 RepID=A0A409VYH4_9AGAR|nr:LOW QUALITY PROTEIN: hypothetical protein CVT26_011954 [Gymnopilus dilepis]